MFYSYLSFIAWFSKPTAPTRKSCSIVGTVPPECAGVNHAPQRPSEGGSSEMTRIIIRDDPSPGAAGCPSPAPQALAPPVTAGDTSLRRGCGGGAPGANGRTPRRDERRIERRDWLAIARAASRPVKDPTHPPLGWDGMAWVLACLLACLRTQRHTTREMWTKSDLLQYS